jgi:hypothetical protein
MMPLSVNGHPAPATVFANPLYHSPQDRNHLRRLGKPTMNDTTAIDGSTCEAYRETEYRVKHDRGFALCIDHTSVELAALCRVLRVKCAAYLTAANPLSEQTSDEVNAQRNAQLASELRGRGLVIVEGIGQHPTGDWPGEPSFLVLGLELEAAKSLGRKYEQNAIVWCGDDACARLVLLR